MKPIESGEESGSPLPERASGGIRKIVIPVVSTVGAFLLLGAGLPWLKSIIPHWVIISGGIVFLWFLLGFFILAVPASAIGIVWSWRGLLRAQATAGPRGFRTLDEVVPALFERTPVLDGDGSGRSSHGSPVLPDSEPGAGRRESLWRRWHAGAPAERRPARSIGPGGARCRRSPGDFGSGHQARGQTRFPDPGDRGNRARLGEPYAPGYLLVRSSAGSSRVSFRTGRLTSTFELGADSVSSRPSCR